MLQTKLLTGWSKANDGKALSSDGGPLSAFEETVRYNLLICMSHFQEYSTNFCSLKYIITWQPKGNELKGTTCKISSGLSAILDWVKKPRNDGNIYQIADRLEDVASMITSPLFASSSTISLVMAAQAMGERSTCVTMTAGDIRHVDAYRYEEGCNTTLDQLVRYDLFRFVYIDHLYSRYPTSFNDNKSMLGPWYLNNIPGCVSSWRCSSKPCALRGCRLRCFHLYNDLFNDWYNSCIKGCAPFWSENDIEGTL